MIKFKCINNYSVNKDYIFNICFRMIKNLNKTIGKFMQNIKFYKFLDTK